MRNKISTLLSVCLLYGLAEAACAATGYQQQNLVSDGFVPAAHIDPNLVNPWGLVFNPVGFSWVADNGSGLSTLYDGNGVAQSLVVSVPGDDGPAAPTGIVFNGSNDFVVNDGAGGHSGPSAFIFASEDGTISGWSPAVPPPAPSTAAQVAVPAAGGAVFKGLAIGTSAGSQFIYATDFHNNRIDVFNSSFAPVVPSGSFSDPNLPAGFAPFGIQNIGNQLFVTYAKQDGAAHDDVPGAGNGFVDVYDLTGHLIQRLVSGGALNSPWGLAMAPSNFGQFSNDLLVGNFGDGTIHAYDPTTGTLLGTLSDQNGNPLVNDGLWALQFGNGLFNQATNALFFTAGPDGEAHGLYGSLTAAPEPSTLVIAGLGACLLVVARARGRFIRQGAH
ncbi:MAG TPA: TIGR03118 family protein [Pirellulales bacterium]|nr:TIGR03118 family protein [Pirellulales bacterium]